MSEVDVQVKGLKEFYAKLEQVSREINGTPMAAAMGKATLVVTRAARLKAPVDRGQLRASIVPQVIIKTTGVQGIVGSNKEYAPYQELGTPAFSANFTALTKWALRKTKNNVKQARALAWKAFVSIREKGIEPKRFLQGALVEKARQVYKIIGSAVRGIIKK